MKFVKILLLIMIFTLGGVLCLAQESVNMGSVSSITGCNFAIYDNGGPTGKYSPSLNQTLTIYPEANQGRVAITISNIDIHQDDTLFIYDSPTATGTPMLKINNSNSFQYNNLTYTASLENTSGALTLRFKSSFFISFLASNRNGFELHTSCAPACQPYTLTFDTALCSKLPTLDVTDGFYYLDLCPGENSAIAVKCNFLNNNQSGYTQKLSTTNIKWAIEGEEQSGLGLNTLNYTFEESNGYSISATAFDTLSCAPVQPVVFRVRTSGNPIVNITNIPQLCVGNEFDPSVGISSDSNVTLKYIGSSQTTSLVVTDTVFLPDGIECPPYGKSYRSNVTFTDFEPGATVTSANDILFVRIKMEHSAIEDLKIKIYCPNNQSNTILPNPNLTGYSANSYFRVNMGSAYRPDGGVSCNSAINPMGEPWNYVWSNNSTLGYQYAPGNGVCYNTQNIHSHYNPHWDDSNFGYFNNTNHSFSVDSTNVQNMTNVYHPYQNFSNLIGCPLNGTWFIEVQDMMGEDNGYIVEWELALDPDLLPEDWSYEVNVDSVYYEHNGIKEDVIIPTEAGNKPYTIHVIDDFGCEFTSNFNVFAHAQPEVNLGGDKTSCDGDPITLQPINPGNNWNYKWNNGSTQNILIVTNPGTYALTASVVQNNVELCKNSDTVNVSFLENSITDIEDEICSTDDYLLNGFNISSNVYGSQSVIYDSLHLQNANGCDSIVALKLKLRPPYHIETQKNACIQYVWEGETLTESGDYVKNYQTIHGCDSILTLHLSIGEPASTEITETVCGQYVWAGDVITESGDYEKTFVSSHECDSLVLLHLTIIDTFLRLSSSNPDFCESHETTLLIDGNFDNYVWNTGETSLSIDVMESGRYVVTAFNGVCEKILFIDVPYCELNILLPNTITPSYGDGLNDNLSIPDYIKNQISDFSVEIYNKYGTLVYKSDDKNFVWDGKVDGKLFPNTIYNYIIVCKNKAGRPYKKQGSILVL